MVTFEGEMTGLLDGGQLAAREAVREVVASGFRPLDSLLPAGGVRRGSLIEWLAGGSGAVGGLAGAGAMSLACAVACRLGRAAAEPGTIVVVDRTGWFHPPAVLPWLGCGSEAVRLVVARPAHDADEIWAIDQALRCTGVAAVLAWPRTAASPGGDLVAGRRCAVQSWTIAMRRWQLAARSSGAVGLFVRPAAARGEASWAEARIAVAPLPGGTLLERRLRTTPRRRSM
jgi:protein ImuA